MLKWYEQPEYFSNITEILNYIFAAIFTTEAIIKMAALGMVYFKDNWNNFDLFVVITTIVGIIVQ